jgi:hypothetical protein
MAETAMDGHLHCGDVVLPSCTSRYGHLSGSVAFLVLQAFLGDLHTSFGVGR